MKRIEESLIPPLDARKPAGIGVQKACKGIPKRVMQLLLTSKSLTAPWSDGAGSQNTIIFLFFFMLRLVIGRLEQVAE